MENGRIKLASKLPIYTLPHSPLSSLRRVANSILLCCRLFFAFSHFRCDKIARRLPVKGVKEVDNMRQQAITLNGSGEQWIDDDGGSGADISAQNRIYSYSWFDDEHGSATQCACHWYFFSISIGAFSIFYFILFVPESGKNEINSFRWANAEDGNREYTESDRKDREKGRAKRRRRKRPNGGCALCESMRRKKKSFLLGCSTLFGGTAYDVIYAPLMKRNKRRCFLCHVKRTKISKLNYVKIIRKAMKRSHAFGTHADCCAWRLATATPMRHVPIGFSRC